MEELRLILLEGEFFIGSEMKEVFNQISDVIYLQIKAQSTDRHYDLEQLQDLESRLVLFAGQNAEMSDVQRFLNVSIQLLISGSTESLGVSYYLYYC